MGEIGRAIDDLGMAIQSDADFAKAYYNRGLIYLSIKGYEAAIADFEKAIEYSSVSTTTILSLIGQGSDDEHVTDLTESLRASYALTQTAADLPMTYYNRGIAYLGLGDITHASADFEIAIQLGLDPEIAQTIEIYLPGP